MRERPAPYASIYEAAISSGIHDMVCQFLKDTIPCSTAGAVRSPERECAQRARPPPPAFFLLSAFYFFFLSSYIRALSVLDEPNSNRDAAATELCRDRAARQKSGGVDRRQWS